MSLEKNSTLDFVFDNTAVIGATMSYDAEKVQKLAAEIKKHKELYYAGNPEVSDQAYDEMESELRGVAPSHPVLLSVGVEGDVPASSKVEHSVPMLSLAKTYVEEDVSSWMEEHEIVGTYKIDGNSLSLVYDNGKLIMGKTRGNGRVGENVSTKISWVADCVPSISNLENYEVRGELYCSDSSFVKLSDEMQIRSLEKPTNPRNIVAGILGRKTHMDLASYFNFFAFDVLDAGGKSPFDTELEKFKWLEQAGFRLPPFEKLTTAAQVNKYLEDARIYMDDGDIGIDGVVFAYNDVSLHRELGSTSHHPRFKLSFKWAGETAQATVNDIVWATSRLGIVTPVAVIDPVYLSGANITNITLHNASHVMAYDLKPGDKIEIIRSGEVIPKFLRVVESANGSHNLPKKCGSCGSELELDEVRLICPNKDGCSAQIMGSVINWIRAAQIDDLSEKRISAMFDIKLIDGVGDLYKLQVDDFLKLPLTKEKMAVKLHQNIQKSKKISLLNFLTGLGIKGSGRNVWELILNEHPTLDQVRALNVDEIVIIKGFADKLATQIVEGLKVKSDIIDSLLEVGAVPMDHIVENREGQIFSGMSFVITGTLSSPRSAIAKDIKNNGGSVGSAVSKNTSVLITNDPDSNSSKAKKARELGIEIWTELQLEEKIK
jgi:DNA ligase (NAD+)